MDVNLASGDNNIGEGDIDKTTDRSEKQIRADDTKLNDEENPKEHCVYLGSDGKSENETVNEKDMNLKERIANCRTIIESLKLELTEEKAKLQEESKSTVPVPETSPFDVTRRYEYNRPMQSSIHYSGDTLTPSDTNYLYATSVDTKLRCDDSLMEYEKQLQRYQDTLTMAQTEKRNAIRKQMLAKVYKLKLLEVENQCNIELLRVKQSLQCLEPLKMIASKWKINENDETCDLNNYELIPRYPELNPISTNDLNIFTDDEKSEFIAPNEEAQL